MKCIDNYQDIIKVIRTYIHDIIGINLKDIRNATDTYGQTLIKLLEGKKYNSYKLSDSVVLLNLETRNNSSDFNATENDSSVYYKSYEVKVIIYGNSSMSIGNAIYSKFNTDYVLSKLITDGIYVEFITSPVLFNEFLNDVIRPRTDLSLMVSVKHKFDNLLNYEFDNINNINVEAE